MTAVRVLGPNESGDVEAVFLESARFYRVSNENPEFEAIVDALREAVESGHPLNIRTSSIDSEIIDAVEQ